MSFISKWFKPSINQLKAKGDAEGLAIAFQDLLKSDSSNDWQKSIEIIGYLNDLSDSRGIKFLPVFFKALFSKKNATPADYRRLGFAALKTVGNKGDTGYNAVLNEIGGMLDTMIDYLVQLELAASMLTQIDSHVQNKAVLKELRKEINSILTNPERIQRESDELLNVQNLVKSSTPVISTDDIQKKMTVLEDAYLVQKDEILEKSVNEALDFVVAKGEAGINVLLERLYKDIKMSGVSIEVFFGGDLAWNEWLRKRAIVYAFGRAQVRKVVPQLISLVEAKSRVQQFYEILQPAAAKSLGEIGDKQAIQPLCNCLRNDDVSNETKRAIGESLEKLEGKPVLDATIIIAKADKMDKKSNGEEVIQLLAQIDSSMFDSLTAQQKYYVWYMRGMVYKFSGDKVKAIDCFQTSLKYFNTPDAMAHSHLAELK